jgi:primosomal protein N' (replication factor Y)
VSCADRRWLPYRASALLEALGRGPRRDSAPLGEAFSWRPLADEDHERLLLDLVARCLGTGRSALVLAPDPASRLLPAVLELAGRVGADLRGSRSDRDRYRDFLRCRMGHARVAVGERGAVFAPLRDLGLVVVDDEANPAYKERRSPRHHAREVALARARMAAAACVLVADLPSAPGWRLVQHGHVRTLAADRRSERDHAPRVDVVDLSDPRPGARRARLSERAAGVLTAAVRAGRTAVVLAARGGQGAALACRGCGRRRSCPLCAASVRPTRGVSTSSRGAEATRHTPGEQWECPACGWTGESSACPDCGDLRTSPLAAGAGRLAQELARSYPGAEVVRMEGFDAPGPTHRPAIAVMTRGSVIARPQWLGDEPVAAVVLPDADAMLRRPTLDASEDALRLWMGIARWTLPRRREAPRPAPGRVVVQTREPAHAAVQALVRWDAEGFWREEAERRAELRYPPSTSLLRIRAPFDRAEAAARAVREAVPAGDEVVGPDLDGATLVKSVDLRGTLAALTTLRHAWARADRKVRVDVDPVPAG